MLVDGSGRGARLTYMKCSAEYAEKAVHATTVATPAQKKR
jgi:hypothetical protein